MAHCLDYHERFCCSGKASPIMESCGGIDEIDEGGSTCGG